MHTYHTLEAKPLSCIQQAGVIHVTCAIWGGNCPAEYQCPTDLASEATHVSYTQETGRLMQTVQFEHLRQPSQVHAEAFISPDKLPSAMLAYNRQVIPIYCRQR